MTLFVNGHTFNLAVRCCPPQGHVVPAVAVEMVGPSGQFKSVVGKVDTGASLTMLNFHTGASLGIYDPTQSPLKKGKARTATSQRFDYYVHPVVFQVSDGSGRYIRFPLAAAFADKVRRNLFGIDWLQHLCLAVDRQAVHFLKD